jgi:hypothetical protein
MWHAWERRENFTRKEPLEKRWRRWEDGIRMDLREILLEVWFVFDWLRNGTGGGLL